MIRRVLGRRILSRGAGPGALREWEWKSECASEGDFGEGLYLGRTLFGNLDSERIVSRKRSFVKASSRGAGTSRRVLRKRFSPI